MSNTHRSRSKIEPRELRLRAKCGMGISGGCRLPLTLSIEANRGKEIFHLELVLSRHSATVLAELLADSLGLTAPVDRDKVLKAVKKVRDGWIRHLGMPTTFTWAKACNMMEAALLPKKIEKP